MSDSRRNAMWCVLAVAGGIGFLITLEIIEEPALTFSEILWELIEPTLIVMTVAGVVHLLHRTNRQHQEQLSLVHDLDVARTKGAKWREDMRQVLNGLRGAIDGQFDRWGLTESEREVALLMLKGLSHKEIAAARGTSEHTVRHQARMIYSKANLSGRAAFSAFFLADLLLPANRRI